MGQIDDPMAQNSKEGTPKLNAFSAFLGKNYWRAVYFLKKKR